MEHKKSSIWASLLQKMGYAKPDKEESLLEPNESCTMMAFSEVEDEDEYTWDTVGEDAKEEPEVITEEAAVEPVIEEPAAEESVVEVEEVKQEVAEEAPKAVKKTTTEKKTAKTKKTNKKK